MKLIQLPSGTWVASDFIAAIAPRECSVDIMFKNGDETSTTYPEGEAVKAAQALVAQVNEAQEPLPPAAPDDGDDENSYYGRRCAEMVKACSFLQDEREVLGLQVGHHFVIDGVPALKAHRDELLDLLQCVMETCRVGNAKDFKQVPTTVLDTVHITLRNAGR